MIIGFCMITLWIPLLAQDRSPRTAEERAKANTEKMKKELSLSDEQAAQAYTANLERAKVVDEFREKNKEEKKEERERIRTAQEKHKAEMKQILTADQYTKWEQWQSEKKEQNRERAKERRGKR